MLNSIDLFIGCGGLTEGFCQARGFKTLAGVDWSKPSVETIISRLNNKWNYKNAEEIILHGDLQKFSDIVDGYDNLEYGSSVGLNSIVGRKKVDIIIGGPPCQAYSIAGRVRDANGMKNDYRNFLFEEYIKILKHFEPEMFVFENVTGILSAQPNGSYIIDDIKKSFKAAGYSISENLKQDAVFDTAYYGVPQHRKRVIIFGVKEGKKSNQKVERFYKLLRSKQGKELAIAKQAFMNIPKLIPLEEVTNKISHTYPKCDIKNHIPRFHNARDINIFRVLTEDIKYRTNLYQTTKDLIKLYNEQTGSNSRFFKYHVIKKEKPSNTIPAHLYKDGLRHIHPDPDQARTITVREAARLQSFDDDFEFLGCMGEQYKMVGNAVPPLFAKSIAETILEV